jgi:hypothetical protein
MSKPKLPVACPQCKVVSIEELWIEAADTNGNPRCPKCLGHPSISEDDYFAAFNVKSASMGSERECAHDPVNHPQHYTSHPSGIECIEVTRHMGFNLGNAIKYIWRADLKNGVEDLEKAMWYLKDEIAKRQIKQEAKPTK